MDNLLYIVITAVVAVVIVAFVVFVRRKNAAKGEEREPGDKSIISTRTETPALVADDVQEFAITIQVELMPATSELDEKSLVEITDRTVIARISETFPTLAEAVAKTVTDKAFKSTDLYKAIIPSSKTLAQSKQMEGAVRGFYRGEKGIEGQAQLVKVDPSSISKASTVASGVANMMNVASLIVGQYYMSVIDSKLESMTKSIDKIGDFQDREFKSRILSLIAHVGEISQFSSEIMENDEQRRIKLIALEDLKRSATELLGQVNITIADIAKKTPHPDYDEYREAVDDFTTLIEYQNALTTVLEEISKLTYLLGKGATSNGQCYSMHRKFLTQSAQTRTLLGEWHGKQVKALRIDISRERISKTGFEALIAAVPGLFVDDIKYKGLQHGLAEKIVVQSRKGLAAPAEPVDVYDDDVQIIIKDGKYYYLPLESGTVSMEDEDDVQE